MKLGALPVEALDAMSCFLTGWDLFQLSHADSQCFRHFSRPTVWTRRLPSGDHQKTQLVGINAKRAYARARSFQFEGLRLDERRSHCGGTDGSGGAVVEDPLTREPLQERINANSSFTLDSWFSVLDGDRGGVLTGGVLLGGQSPLMRSCLWTNHHVALVAVDADRNLFCSVLDDAANCVATRLDFARWYHLALTFDRGLQRVYLDGELVSELQGELYHSWGELSQVQVGTGFVSSFWRQKLSLHFDTRPRGVRTFCGWHNFNGLVDEFRVWGKPLCGEDVRALAGGSDDVFIQDSPWYSLRRAATNPKLHRVVCTRPTEHLVEMHKPARHEWRLETSLVDCWHCFHNYLSRLPQAAATV